MLFFIKKLKKTGCVSAGAAACVSYGWNITANLSL